MQNYITQLEKACKEYKELLRMREELEAEMEATAAQIKEIMGERETVTAGPFKASNKLVTSQLSPTWWPVSPDPCNTAGLPFSEGGWHSCYISSCCWLSPSWY